MKAVRPTRTPGDRRLTAAIRAQEKETRAALNAHVPTVCRHLKLKDLGDLGEPGAGRVVRKVRLASGELAALKLQPTSADSEACALRAYQETGAAVRVLAAGTDPVPFLLTALAPGSQPSASRAGDLVEDAVKLAAKLRVPAAPETPDLTDAIASWLPDSQQRLSAAGLPVPDVDALLTRARASSSATLIHGDFWRKNVLESDDGALTVIDASGVRGPPECDVARWLTWGCGTPVDLEPLIDRALRADPTLSSDCLRALVAIELIGRADMELKRQGDSFGRSPESLLAQAARVSSDAWEA